MKLRIFSVIAMLAALLAPERTPAAGAASKPPVLAHYMPWFQSKPFSGSWGWHWTMNHFNPDLTSNGQAQIASWYYPLIGPYDSADPAVLEYHVLLMKLAGIDGVIVDWYGMDNYNDYAINNTRTLDLLGWTRKAGLKFSLCWEDATIQQEINGGFITAANAISHAQLTMLYAQANYFNDPTYLRRSNAPVLLNFGPQYFHATTAWTSNFSVLAASNQPSFYTEDNLLTSVGAGAFDWPPMYLSQTNPQSPTEPVLSDTQMNIYLNAFDAKAKAWAAFVASAFPRFHDIYAQAGVQPSFGYLDDQNGATFTENLSRAMTNGSSYIQLATWNDFGEGTVIEPTTQYGYRDLGVIQNFRRQYLDTNFTFRTNELTLPLRLYNLRKRFGTTNAVLSAEMDRIFTNIVSTNLAAAELQLTGMESNVPVIYNPSATNGLLRFSVGGYVYGTTIKVISTPTLLPGPWQTNMSFSVTTNLISFSTNIPSNSPAMFFKLQKAGP